MSTKKEGAKKKIQSSVTPKDTGIGVLAGIIVISLIILSKLITNFFLNIDDDVYFTLNPYIKSLSFENIKSIFIEPYGGNYHPITTLFEAVEYNFFKLNATPYHFVSLLTHLINTVLVFTLAGKFFNRIDLKAIITFIFALHPMHVESVAWISDKTDLYYTFFFLLGMLSYIKYVNLGKMKFLVPTFIYFVLSILSKPAAIAFPFILILIDYFFEKEFKKELIHKIPFFLVAVIFGYITYFALHIDTNISVYLMPEYSIFERFFVANYAFCYYIYKFFLPFGLSALHFAPQELPFYYYLAPIFSAAILYLIFKSLKYGHQILFGFLFYFFTICLVLQVIPVGYSIVAERYTYLPYLGLSFIVAQLIIYVENSTFQFPKAIKGNLKTIAYSFLGLLLVLTFVRTMDWKDLRTFNRNIADQNPMSAFAQLGAAYHEMAVNNTDEALYYLNKADETGVVNHEVAMIKGKAYSKLQKNDNALKEFQLAQKLGSTDYELENFLATSYLATNKFDSAEFYFTKVIEKDTVFSFENHRNRAICNYYLEHYQKAIDDYSAMLKVDSALGSAYSERGVCYQKINELEKACADWHLAVKFGYNECLKDIEENCK